MWLLAVSLFSLSLPGSGRSAKLPGVVTVINEQFFEAETRKLFDDLEKDLLRRDDLSVSGRDGRLSWALTSLGVYHFDGPTTDIEITSINDKAVFTLEMEDATIKTSFNWAATYDMWLTDIRISGRANAKLYNVNMNKSIALGITDSGRLELSSRDCQLDSCCSLQIDDMNISVYGGAVAWIIDKTMSWWEGEIKDMIKKESCKRIDAIINTELNRALRSFPTRTQLVHEDLHLNYTLLHLDTVDDCLVVGVDGGITPALRDNLLCNVTEEHLLGEGGPQPLPASDCVTDDYDFSTKISLDTIQGLVDSIFQAGLLGSFSLNESTIQNVKSFQPGYFKNEKDKKGKDEKEKDRLLQHYLLNVDVNITSPPSVTINTTLSCIDMDVPTSLQLVMLHPNQSKDKRLLLTLDSVFSVGVQFKVAKEFILKEGGGEQSKVKLLGNIVAVQSTFQSSAMNEEYEMDIDLSTTSTLLNQIRAHLIQPRVEKHLENGVPTDFGDVFDVEVSRFRYFENYVEFDGTIEEWTMNM